MNLECKICGFQARNNNSLSAHIRHSHKMSVKDYFDGYIEPWEHKCIRCGKPTLFCTLSTGYRIACNNVMCMKDARRATCLSRYGDSTYHNQEKQLETIRKTSKEEFNRRVKKAKKTKKERYGNENYQNIEAIRTTCIKKYGVNCVFKAGSIKEKIKSIHRERRGVDYPSQSPECRQKTKRTLLEHYGVSSTGESKELQEKARQTSIIRHGNPNYRNVDKQRETVSKKSREELERIIEKRKSTCLKKYGVDTVFGVCPRAASISNLSKRVKKILDEHQEVEYTQELRIITSCLTNRQ